MLMPQELRKYVFNHAIRGYSTAEVDEYIEFLCEKYEEIYRENDELTRKLEAALRALDAAKTKENSASALSTEAKRVSARMLAEAEAQKKRIVTDAEEYADRIIADADAHVAEQAQVLESMRRSVLAFRDDLYSRYSRQIDEIEAFAAAAQAMSGMDALPEEAGAPFHAPAEIAPLPIIGAEAIEAAEEEAEEVPDPIAEAEESIENLFSEDAEDAEEEIPAEADETDEEEVAATDEVLLFFDSLTPGDSDDNASSYAEVDADVYALAEQHKDETEFSYDTESEGNTADLEELLPALEEPEEEPDAEAGEDEDPAEADEEGESDEDLLKNLREAFHIQFETFTTEASEEENGDFRFLEESEEEEEEPSGLLARLKSAMDASDKNKKDSREKEMHR